MDIGHAIAVVTALVGWVLWRVEHRERAREKAAKELAEGELARIHREASAFTPYLAVSDLRFDSVQFNSEQPGQMFVAMAGGAGMLDFIQQEVGGNFGARKLVYLLVDNHGQQAHEIAVYLDGRPVDMIGMKKKFCDVCLAIRYPFVPELYGVEQTVLLKFRSTLGKECLHTYRTRHGFRLLERVNA